MTKLIPCLLIACAFSAQAQTENDYLRDLSHAERKLNEYWNERLTPTDRDRLRADERRWAAWKDTLSTEQEAAAVWKRIDFLQAYVEHHGG
jgi:hypothetical protein